MLLHLQDIVIPFIFLTGLIAGTVDAIAGGGGLISLPILLTVGVPPHIALGTNKLQGSIGTAVATFTYYRKGLLSFKTISKGLFFGIVGTVAGSVLGQILSSDLLKKIIPFLLISILIYTIFSPKLGKGDQKPKINEFIFYVIFGFALGFYDGFFGPGTGSLWLFSLTLLLGYNLTKATAYTKIFNLKSNLIATICFAIGHNIDYKIGLVMALGQLLGGKFGAHLAIKNGASLIRPIFLIVVSITIISLLQEKFSQATFIIWMFRNKLLFLFILLCSVFIISFLCIIVRKFIKTS